MSEQHAPGPWIAAAHFADRCGGRTYIPILRPGNDPVPVAVVHRDVDGRGRDEGESNANLIAAAPDLLYEIKRARNAIDSHAPECGSCRSLIPALDRLIAKATGANAPSPSLQSQEQP